MPRSRYFHYLKKKNHSKCCAAIVIHSRTMSFCQNTIGHLTANFDDLVRAHFVPHMNRSSTANLTHRLAAVSRLEEDFPACIVNRIEYRRFEHSETIALLGCHFTYLKVHKNNYTFSAVSNKRTVDDSFGRASDDDSNLTVSE